MQAILPTEYQKEFGTQIIYVDMYINLQAWSSEFLDVKY